MVEMSRVLTDDTPGERWSTPVTILLPAEGIFVVTLTATPSRLPPTTSPPSSPSPPPSSRPSSSAPLTEGVPSRVLFVLLKLRLLVLPRSPSSGSVWEVRGVRTTGCLWENVHSYGSSRGIPEYQRRTQPQPGHGPEAICVNL